MCLIKRSFILRSLKRRCQLAMATDFVEKFAILADPTLIQQIDVPKRIV